MSELKVKRDPVATQRRILAAATEEFTRAGLSGARIDQIARKAQTNERMLYYYFGSKEQLFSAVLEQVYTRFCTVEREIALADLEPVAAIARLAQSIWQYFREHPEILQLINNENMHEARYLKQLTIAPSAFAAIAGTMQMILSKGQAAGLFRSDVDPVLLFVTICGLGFYVVSNRHTIEVATGNNYAEGVLSAAAVEMHTAMLLAYLKVL